MGTFVVEFVSDETLEVWVDANNVEEAERIAIKALRKAALLETVESVECLKEHEE